MDALQFSLPSPSFPCRDHQSLRLVVFSLRPEFPRRRRNVSDARRLREQNVFFGCCLLRQEEFGFDRFRCGHFNGIVNHKSLFEPMLPAACAPQLGMLLKQPLIILIQFEMPGSPAAILFVRVLIPLRELIDDMKHLRRP